MKFLSGTIVAIIAIAILEAIALFRGIDGAGLAGAVAIIAGLGGYSTSKITRKK